MITEEEKRMAINLAMKIDVGEISPVAVLVTFENCPTAANEIIEFWLSFNDLTKSVAAYLATEKARMHLENCYEIEVKECSKTKQNLRLIANGLKQICYGVKECITGVLKDIVEL